MTPFGVNVKGVGIPFMIEARNKRYMTLDIKIIKDRRSFQKIGSKGRSRH